MHVKYRGGISARFNGKRTLQRAPATPLALYAPLCSSTHFSSYFPFLYLEQHFAKSILSPFQWIFTVASSMCEDEYC